MDRVILVAERKWLTSAASVARAALDREGDWPSDNLLLYEKGDQQFAVRRNKASITVYHQGDAV